MCNGNNIRQIEKTGIDLMGFIFYPGSPRYVSKKPEYLPENVGKVGVFVNESVDSIQKKIKLYHLDYIQLHGEESPELCKKLQKNEVKVIKAFPIANEKDLEACIPYIKYCDFFLFDTRSPERGGSGKSFSWDILKKYSEPIPFLLSGGIGPDDIPKIKRFSHPRFIGIDLNSHFETAPGFKDPEKLKKFIDNLKSLDKNEQN